MTWLAPAATFAVPAAMIGLAAWLFGRGGSEVLLVAMLLGFPLGLASGYLLVGAPMRGLAVVGIGYLALFGALALIFMLPTTFEDAGVLLAGAAVALAVLLAGGAGVAAWDVHRLAVARPAP